MKNKQKRITTHIKTLQSLPLSPGDMTYEIKRKLASKDEHEVLNAIHLVNDQMLLLVDHTDIAYNSDIDIHISYFGKNKKIRQKVLKQYLNEGWDVRLVKADHPVGDHEPLFYRFSYPK